MVVVVLAVVYKDYPACLQAYHCPAVTVETVESDCLVVDIAVPEMVCTAHPDCHQA